MSAAAIASSSASSLTRTSGSAAYDRPKIARVWAIEIADRVLVVRLVPEVGAVAVVDEGEDAAAHRDAGFALVPGLLPGRAIGLDLLALLDVEGLAGLVELERRALEVHAQLRRPDRRGVGGRAPPDPVAQARRVRLEVAGGPAGWGTSAAGSAGRSPRP